jgi:hypothetical protein
MFNFIGKIFISMIVFGQIVYQPNAIAYKPEVHKKITEYAVLNSQRIRPALEATGFLPLGGELEWVEINTMNLSEWIQRGADWEDGIQIVWGEPQDIAFCHFFNPVTDQGYTLPSGAEIGQSLIERSHDVTNEWSYVMAKQLYYAALIGDNSEIVDGFTRMRVGWLAPYFLYQKTNMIEEDRDQYFAWTLQALGHTLHLIQDASVPAHTRNDFHGLLEPYEKWTNENLKYLEDNLFFIKIGSTPWAYWIQHADIIAPDVFIDTAQLDANDTAPISGPDQGIAEYSHANFMSEGTIFAYDLPAKADWSGFFTNYQSEDFNLDVRPVNGQDITFVYLRNKHPGGVSHLVLAGVLHPHPISSAVSYDVRWTTNDNKVNEDYAAKLIPKAVGYSAGLLDYFFRGSMDIRNFTVTYGNGEAADLVINAVNFDVANITPSPTQPGSGTEPMQNGALDLVCRYMPPGGGDRVYEVVKDIYMVGGETDAINTGYVSLFIPLDQSLPIGASDMAFTLVYRGGLGNETDSVVAGAVPLTTNSRIAYYYQPGGPPNLSNVYASLTDSSDERAITVNASEGVWYFEPAWSPDGTRMAISKQACGATGADGYCVDDFTEEIAIVDLETFHIISTISPSDPYFGIHPILPLVSPDFSRDGNKIAAIVDKLDMGFNGIVIYDLNSGAWHYLNGFEFWHRKRINGSAPAWSPVRDEILYYVHQQPNPVTNEMALDRDIYLISSDGSNNRWLTDDDYANIQPSWSPGGDWIIFASDRDGGDALDIWMMDREGGNLRKLRDCASGCYHPNFSPDGLRLAFEEYGDIYTMDVSGGNLKAVTNLGYKTTAPAWSPYLTEPTLDVEASATTVNPGQPVTLSWVSEYADLAEFKDGTGTVSINTSDTLLVYPTETTTYTIQVTGLGGRATQAVTIDVTTTVP